MGLAAFALILIALVMGMKLLAQAQKDSLSNIYKYVAWFVILMSILSMLCAGTRCIMRHCCHMGMHKECMMREECDDDDDDCYMGGGMMHRHMMMECHRHMMGGGCCEGMMQQRGGCCDGNTEGGSCKEGSECHEASGCKDNDGGKCSMMGGSCNMGNKDTAKGKK